METKYGITIIAIITAVIGMSAIFAGCNEEFSNEDNSISYQKICEDYSSVRSQGTNMSPFEKCVIKQENRANLCVDYFSWLRI